MRAILAILLVSVLAAPPAAALDLEARRMLSAAESLPWKGVGRVNVATIRQRGMCTGTLIAPDLVMTAAHCLVDPVTGDPFAPGNVHFVAGWRQGQMAAHRQAQAIALHPRYHHREEPGIEEVSNDLAIIRLDSEIAHDDAPAFRVGPLPLNAQPLTLISYRQDRAHALTRQQGCELVGQHLRVLALACEVTQGVSGSPVFSTVAGEAQVVAVVSAMGRAEEEEVAFAVRVDNVLAELLAVLD